MVMVDLFNYVLYCFMAILPRHGAKLQTPPTANREAQADQQTRRARQLIHQGELSAAREALTAAALAPGDDSTLQELRDPNRRPPEPYQQPEPQPATNARPPANFVACQFEEGTQGSSPWAHRPHSRNPPVGARRLRDHASLCRRRH